jgi:hypothetical protein
MTVCPPRQQNLLSRIGPIGQIGIIALTLGIGISMPQPSFAMGKKSYVRIASPQEWASTIDTLTEKSAQNTDKLGVLQAGPYILNHSKKGQFAILTTVSDDRCYSISKPLNRLHDTNVSPTIQKISCDKGIEMRNEATVPEMPGYGPLSTKGRELLAAATGTAWRASRDCFFSQSSGKRELWQSFTFWLKGNTIETASEADAFTHKFVPRRTDWDYKERRLLATREQWLENGKIRLLIWADGVPHYPWLESQIKNYYKKFYPTSEHHRMRMTFVDPELIHATDQITLHPSDKICTGSACRPVAEVQFTQYATFHYMVIEMDQEQPNRITLELNQVTPTTPVHRFDLERGGS